MTAPAVPDPVRSCHSKHRYGTAHDACAVAAKAWRQRRHWLRAYLCEDCGGWHLTHHGALPPQGANWRPPRKSQRTQAREAKRRRRR